MRHGKKINQLSRTTSHRKAMFANMASSLIEHKRINTTTAKAKALRQFVEPLITKSKTDTTHNRRLVFAKLRNKQAVSELFREIAPKVGDRPGGYTRVIKLGNRLGDNADMAMIELVDYNEIYDLKSGGEAKKTTRRSRRGGKTSNAKKSDSTATSKSEDNKTSEDKKTAENKKAEPKAESKKKPAKDEKKDSKTDDTNDKA